MTPLPTVRVANPAAPGTFMTINAVDLSTAHEVWSEQAEGYIAPSSASLGLDPAVRDTAAALMIGMVSARLAETGVAWLDLPGPEQVAALADAEADCTDLLAPRETPKALDPSQDSVGDPPAPAPALPIVEARTGALSVGKGPRGLWYVRRDGQRFGIGHQIEADAHSAMIAAG